MRKKSKEGSLLLKKIFFPLFVSLIIALVLQAQTAHATLIIGASIEELTAQADLVVEGTVVQVTSFWQEGQIVTQTTIEVDSLLKANESYQTIELITLGGRVGDMATRVVGTTSFQPDQEVVVFLVQRERYFTPLAMAFSSFEIISDREELEPLAIRRIENLRILSNDPSSGGRVIENFPAQLPLNELRRRIETVVSQENR